MSENVMVPAELDDDMWRQAVAAIDAGDVDRLRPLLAADARLVTDRLGGSPEWLRLQMIDALVDAGARDRSTQ